MNSWIKHRLRSVTIRVIFAVLIVQAFSLPILGQDLDEQYDWTRIDSTEDMSLKTTRLDSIDRSGFSIGDSLQWLKRRSAFAVTMADYETGWSLIEEGIKLAETVHADSLALIFHYYFAVAYYHLQQPESALIELNHVLKSIDQYDMWRVKAGVLNMIAAIHTEKNDFETAISILNDAIHLRHQQGDTSSENLLVTYRVLGTTYHWNESYDKADSIFRYLVPKAELAGDSSQLSNALIYYSDLLTDLGKLDDALKMSKRAVQIQRDIKRHTTFFISLEKRAEQLALAGQYDEAYDLMKESNELEMSSYRNNLEDRISEMEVKYETDRIKQEKKIAEEEAKANALALQLANGRNQLLIAIIIAVLALAAMLVAFYLFRQQRQKAHTTALLQQERMAALIEAEDRERLRVSQELHDGISQMLSALKMNLSAVGLKDPASGKLLDEAIAEVRSISHDLHPAALAEGDLVKALHHLVEVNNQSQRLQLSVTTNVDDGRFPKEMEKHVYRIIQELINNTIRHAKASEVQISVQSTEQILELIYKDDGVGLMTHEFNRSNGIGWKNIKARLEVLNASVDLVAPEQSGTYLRFIIPLK